MDEIGGSHIKKLSQCARRLSKSKVKMTDCNITMDFRDESNANTIGVK